MDASTGHPGSGEWLYDILHYRLEQFEPDERHAQREVNQTVSRTHEEYATLHRELIDSRYMARELELCWRIA